MDMKGGLAAILATTKYYSENKDKFTGELILAFVSEHRPGEDGVEGITGQEGRWLGALTALEGGIRWPLGWG